MSSFPKTGLGWKIKIWSGTFKSDSFSGKAGKIVALIVVIAFSVAATFFFQLVFEKLGTLQGIGSLLLFKMIRISLVTLFFMLLISNLITGIATLFRSDEIAFMLARPVSFGRIFLNQFIDNLYYSSWSLAVIGIPMIIAWGIVNGVSIFTSLVILVFGLLPLVLIAAELGVLLLVGVVLLIRLTSPKIVAFLFALTIILLTSYFIVQRSESLQITTSSQANNLELIRSPINSELQYSLSPPHWLAQSMINVRTGNFRKMIFVLALLSMSSVLWLKALTSLMEHIYYPSWIAFNEITSKTEWKSSIRSASKFNRGILPNPLHAMLRKDLLQFSRNPSQWGQFLILVAFLIVYLINLVYLSFRFNLNAPHWKTLVIFLNFSFTGFILATLSVRFVFPLISLEGRGFWLVRAAPISVNLLFWQKFFLAFTVFMGLCQLIVWISNQVLSVSSEMVTLTTTGIFLMGVALTGFSIGMGALFPVFDEESPMRIASTPGGIMTVVISLCYVALMVAVLAWPVRGYYEYLTVHSSFPTLRILLTLGFITGIHVLIILIPVRMGRRAIENRDV